VALVLACSFGTYGLLKKRADVGAVEGLAVETVLLAPLAAGYLVVLQATGDSTLTTDGVSHVALLIGTGLITALPLLLFAAAATRVPLTTIGLLQYLAPVMQFVLGLVVFREDMTPGRWWGFAAVWIALAIVTAEAVLNARRVGRATRSRALTAASQSA
jgi:chloramphenicol-sensitive protein RarD